MTIVDPREAARRVLAFVQAGEPLRCTDDEHLAAGPAQLIPYRTVGVAAGLYFSGAGPDRDDEHGHAAYAWVAGVMAGHHVTASPLTRCSACRQPVLTACAFCARLALQNPAPAGR